MPQFFVTKRNSLRDKCHDVGATHVVSLIDVESRTPTTPPGVASGDHIIRRFDDVFSPVFDVPSNSLWGPSHWPPTADDARVLAAFCKRLPAEAKCVVHCEAGVSRSTAAALAFHVFHHGFEGAVDWLLNERPIALPNTLLAHHFDKEFGFEGKLEALADMVGAVRVNRPYGN